MEHVPATPSKHVTPSADGKKLALRDHHIFGTFGVRGKEESFDIKIIKGKTKLSEIPDFFLETVKTEGLF